MNTLSKIRDFYAEVNRFGEEFEREYHLSLTEGILLSTLKQDKKLSLVDLSKKICLTCSNSARILKSLADRNLVERTIDKKEKNPIFFSLTKEGEEKIDSVKLVNIPLILR